MASPLKSQTLTGRSWAALAFLILLGFLGNFYSFPLFFGADFLFGSTAVLLILFYYGLFWGLLAAIMANWYTYFLWGHPYGFIMFFLEALWVGYLLRSGRRNLFLLDGVFWLLIGLPLNLFFYYVVLYMDTGTTGFIILKQGINGIFNALLASLAINYLPLDRLLALPPARRTFSIQEGFFNLMAALVLAPVLLLTVVEIREEMQNVEQKMMTDLETISCDLQFHLHAWYEEHLPPMTELAMAAGKSAMIPSAKLQHDVEMLKKSFPDFLTLHVENSSGVTIACSPATNEKGSTIGVDLAGRPWFREVKATHRVVLSEVFQGSLVTLSPTVILSTPILQGNQFLGNATASLDLRRISKLLEPYGKDRGMDITITDAWGRVIASTSAQRAPLQYWDRRKVGLVEPVSSSMFRWFPPEENLPSMTRWKQSLFVAQSEVAEDIPWVLTVEAPIAAKQQYLYTIYVKNLTVMAVLILVTLLLTPALSRWLVSPLNKLAQVTTDLPDKIMAHRNIDWPASEATEVDSLIGNFQSMTRALEQNFQEQQEHGKELACVNEGLQLEITERREAEQALRDSEAKYRSLIDNASEAMLLTDIDGNFLDANRKAEELLGHSKAELLRMNVRQVHPEEDLERVMTSFKKTVLNGGRSLSNIRLLRKDGMEVPVDITSSTIEYAGKTMTQEILKDITARQSAEAERVRFSKLESLSTLAGGIAHDFNNILTVILGNISLTMLYGKTEPKVQDQLVNAEQACLKAQGLSQQLLTFAKGGAPIKKIISISKLLKDTIGLVLSGSESRYEFSTPDDLRSVEGDEAQLSQVISNLLINADQAMPAGGIILIKAENISINGKSSLPISKGRYVSFAIADEGIGIPSKYLDKIFDPYFSTKQKGSGLGLATAYSIIKNHSGHIQVESQVGVGTTFYIYLPAAENGVPAAEPETIKLARGQGKILVMDDEEMVREVLGAMLRQLGYEVDFSSDGSQAIEEFVKAKETNQPFAAIILDLTIPGGMGGKEAIIELLKIDPQVKAIVSSGYSDNKIMADFQKYGFAGVIPKPYKVAELGRALNKVLSQGN